MEVWPPLLNYQLPITNAYRKFFCRNAIVSGHAYCAALRFAPFAPA